MMWQIAHSRFMPMLCVVLMGAGSSILAQTSALPEGSQTQNLPADNLAQAALPIIVFDRNSILSNALMGVAVTQKVEALQQALEVENDQIAKDLEAEEKELTRLKETLTEIEFERLAVAFDTKATGLRAQQAARAKDVAAQYQVNLREFEASLNETLSEVARGVGALAVFERQHVYLRSESIDVSNEIIRRLDEEFAAAQNNTAQTQPTATQDEVQP